MKSRRLLILSIPLALTACDNKGSLGEFDGDGGSGGATGDDGDDADDSVTASATSTGDGDGNPEDGASDSSDDGDVLLCVDGNCAVSCETTGCGPLDEFDEIGCKRPSCQQDAECAADERCYVGDLFGQCVSSGWGCDFEAESGACVCGGTADCNGGYCVDANDYPQPEAGPTGPARLETGCAPDDGPATDILIGLVDGSCPAEFGRGATAYFSIWELGFGETGTFAVGNQSTNVQGYGTLTDAGGNPQPVMVGTVTITEWGLDAGIAGNYEVFVGGDEDGVASYFAGTFADAQYCDTTPPCG